MTKKEIFNHYSNIIDTMLENSIWFDAFFQAPINFDESLIPEDDLPDHIQLHSGATRTCIIDEDYDWVVKFDIEEDADGYACQREVNIYQAAKECSLSKYFSEVMYVGTYVRTLNFYDIIDLEQKTNCYCQTADEFIKDLKDHEEEMDVRQIQISFPLYAYRKANGYNFKTPYTPERKAMAERIGSPLRSRNVIAAIEFISRYGFKEYEKFSQFGLEWQINDLHLNNFGDIDGELTIIDYAGYHDGEDYNNEDWTIGSEDEEEEDE